MEITRLQSRHDRRGFDCGVPALKDFLQRYANQNERRSLSRTYVATGPEDDSTIIGYVTVRVGEVACDDLQVNERKSLPNYPVPVLHLARLGVDKRATGKHVGQRLLLHALQIAADISARAGLIGVEVMAKNDDARRFYERFGFCSLTDDERHLYLSIETIRTALLP